MKKTITLCDKCRNPIEEGFSYLWSTKKIVEETKNKNGTYNISTITTDFHIELKCSEDISFGGGSPYKDSDICEDCQKKILTEWVEVLKGKKPLLVNPIPKMVDITKKEKTNG